MTLSNPPTIKGIRIFNVSNNRGPYKRLLSYAEGAASDPGKIQCSAL